MELKKRLTSRAFWLAVGTIITFIANDQWTEAMGVAIAYITGDRLTNVAEKVSGVNRPIDTIETYTDTTDEVDTNSIVSGRMTLEEQED